MQILMNVNWVHIYVTVMLHVTTQMEATTVLANLAFLALAQSVKVRINKASLSLSMSVLRLRNKLGDLFTLLTLFCMAKSTHAYYAYI